VENMVIVITYDEFGGAWDHVAPAGRGFARPRGAHTGADHFAVRQKSSVDHTPYDTVPSCGLMIRRFDLASLPGIVRRDRALAEHGEPPMAI